MENALRMARQDKLAENGWIQSGRPFRSIAADFSDNSGYALSPRSSTTCNA